MNKTVFVSIIIPVYNVKQKYLKPCIDSALNQTFKDIEIIIVNDGSTAPHIDPILKTYAEQDDRIVYVSKENGGTASAREKGIELAQGEYLYFLDSDDMLMPNAVKLCCEKAVEANADIVVGNYVKEYKNKYVEKKNFLRGTSTLDALKSVLMKECSVYLWDKFFRSELFSLNNIDTPKYLCIGEDFVTCVQLICAAKKVVQIDEVIYKHVINANSVMRNMSKRQRESLLLYIEWFEDFFQNKFEYKTIENELAYSNLLEWALFLASGYKSNDKFNDEHVRHLVYNKYLQNDFARKKISKGNLLLIKTEQNIILKWCYNFYAGVLKPILQPQPQN